MKVIIAGSRTITDIDNVAGAIERSLFKVSEVVSGTARGVDQLGEYWAEAKNVPIKLFFPDWKTYGKAAGYKRNEQMAEYADALVAIWDGKSKGTGHMIDTASKKKLDIYVEEI